MDNGQYGRWTTHSALQPYGKPDNALALAFALLAINEQSKGEQPGPAVAKITVSRADGTTIGTFEVDATDAQALSKHVSQMSDERYGPIERQALERLMRAND
ncbi:hypothetical protein ACGFX8_08850 [Streptomyces sp. NPDC048362]|uniref:hypothetical protein n=1 Tax=Streptomyces sp. NPDC048362 TaxID=3365539 RepID=UPI00372262DB